MNHENIEHSEQEFQSIKLKIQELKAEIHKHIIGQEELIDTIIIALLANGHTLLEGLPGLAKTRTVSVLAQALDMYFKRIQFTPDLLPSDVLGAEIYNVKTGSFEIKKGPIFANFILADEINRAPSKVQSALLEAMADKQITIGNETFALEQPFLVLATQNPIEQAGTYSLPEAQLDRFMFKVLVSYPSKSEEQCMYKNILENQEQSIQKLFQKNDIFEMQKVVKNVFVSDSIYEYVANIIEATRFPEKVGKEHLKEYISYGASPRGGLSLIAAAKAKAAMLGRGYVIPEDIKNLAKRVLSHRIMLSYEAIAQDQSVDMILDEILQSVSVV